jgi:AcrR family transcriptional regulator
VKRYQRTTRRKRGRDLAATRVPTPPGRRERRSAEIRERLFRAALRLFAEKGFAETTVVDITEAADLGKGTFFNYFPSKDHILVAFGDMQLGKLTVAVEQARQSSEPMPEFMSRLSRMMTEEPGRNPAIVRLILAGPLSREPVRSEIRERLARGRRLLTELMSLGQARGEIRRDRAAADLGLAMQQAAFGTLLMWSLSPDEPLLTRMDNTFSLLWSGMHAQPGTAAPATPPVDSES